MPRVCGPLVLGALFVCWQSNARAETYEITPQDDLFGTLGNLAAGDEVIVHEGTYQTPGFYEVEWVGTAEAPIVIRAVDGARPVIQGDPSQNVINIDGAYFTFSGFEITGGSHGLRLGNVERATFENLVIHDVEDVALSCNRPDHMCDAIVVRACEIYNTGRSGTGEGMYIGCNDGACVVRDSQFIGNFLHDLDGSQADGIEIKTGSHGNVVRDNVIVGANYPAITMYGFADGAGAPNLVERNFVWGTVDNGIQVVGQVIVRNNVIVDAGANGIHSKNSQGFFPGNVQIIHNTIVNAGGACLKTNDWSGQLGQIVANNALYCEGGLAVDINGGAPEAEFSANVAAGEIRAPDGFVVSPGADADLRAPNNLSLTPGAGSTLIDAGDPDYSGVDDFDGRDRSDGMPDVGAYEYNGDVGAAWPLSADFKELAPGVEPVDPVDPPVHDGCRATPTSHGWGGALWLGLVLLIVTRRERFSLGRANRGTSRGGKSRRSWTLRA